MTAAPQHPGKALLIAATIVLGLTAGAAGYWTGSGSGTATTTLPNPQALTMSPGTPATLISPGGTAAVAAIVSNPNPYTVQISSISLDTAQGTGGFAVDGSHSGCGLSTLGFTTQTNGGSGWTVPAKVGATPGSLTISMSGALTMGSGAADACQGASFTVYLSAVVS
jgi:hypothetical protein